MLSVLFVVFPVKLSDPFQPFQYRTVCFEADFLCDLFKRDVLHAELDYPSVCRGKSLEEILNEHTRFDRLCKIGTFIRRVPLLAVVRLGVFLPEALKGYLRMLRAGMIPFAVEVDLLPAVKLAEIFKSAMLFDCLENNVEPVFL